MRCVSSNNEARYPDEINTSECQPVGRLLTAETKRGIVIGQEDDAMKTK